MEEPKRTIGLLLEIYQQHGTHYVIARVLSRRAGEDYPVGLCSMDDEGRSLDGLAYYGHVNEDIGEPGFVCHGVMFKDCYHVELPRARAMTKTLDRITKRLARDNAWEHGDALLSIAKAIGATWMVHRAGDKVRSSYADNEWRFMTLNEGRNHFRHLIEKAVNDAKARRGVRAA